MSETPTPENVRTPGLTGLVTAFRNYAGAADDQQVAEAYAHCASLLTMHIDRLLGQNPDRLNGPDLRARLTLVEQELGRARERATVAAPAPVDPDVAAMLPELAEHADNPAAVPNDALLRDVDQIARQYRGLAYDPHDRPEEILAVRRAAVRAGLVPFPSEALAPFRGYRGASPPQPKPAAAAVVTNTTGAPITLAPASDRGHRAVTLQPGDVLVVTATEPGAR